MEKPRTLIVTIPNMISDDDLVGLRQRSEVKYHEVAKISEDELAALCSGFDYLMLNYDAAKKLTAQFYAHPNVRALKAISADITGMDWASPHGAVKNGVSLLNTPHYSTESVAESIISEVLLHSRQRHSAYVDELSGRSVQARSGFNLLGRTAGIVGLGDIGSRVAEVLACIGMEVIAWNRSPREGSEIVTLPELFERSKIICICLKTVKSGADSNVRIVNDDLLNLCRESVVVNLANVDLVDHAAMARAIRDGRVVGYSVERNDSLLATDLATLDVVHLPPSNAWSSDESLERLRETWVGNILAAIDGRTQNAYSD